MGKNFPQKSWQNPPSKYFFLKVQETFKLRLKLFYSSSWWQNFKFVGKARCFMCFRRCMYLAIVRPKETKSVRKICKRDRMQIIGAWLLSTEIVRLSVTAGGTKRQLERTLSFHTVIMCEPHPDFIIPHCYG